jgi:hypothetical protein
MSWFGWFRKSNGDRAGADAGPQTSAQTAAESIPNTPAPTADEVRRLLFDAVAAGDNQRLESLCQEHKDFILTQLAGWLEVPASFRASPETYEWYGNGLRAVAKFCAEKLGHDDVLHRLESDGSSVAAGRT